MSVFKRSKGKWVVQVYDPATKRMRQAGTRPTRAEAKQLESDTIARSTGQGGETIASFARRWTRDYPRKRASTNLHNAERIRQFRAAHARRRIDSITIEEARTWARDRPGDLPALRAMFNDARRSGLVTVNPFAALGLSRSRGRRDLASEWLTEHDIDHLAACALKAHGEPYGQMFAAMIRFAAWTGVRPGELWALTRSDLRGDELEVKRAADSKTRTIGPTKTGRPRTIVLPDAAREAVERMPTFHGQDRLFVAPRGGQLWAPNFSVLWRPVRVLFDRPTMALYELRHFCATRLLELGLSPADVAVQLGHTDGGALVMSTYGHPSDRAARARIRAAVDGPTTALPSVVRSARREDTA